MYRASEVPELFVDGVYRLTIGATGEETGAYELLIGQPETPTTTHDLQVLDGFSDFDEFDFVGSRRVCELTLQGECAEGGRLPYSL